MIDIVFNHSFIPKSTITASDTTPSFPVSETQIAMTLDVTAASGTSPTLDVVIEDSADEVTWNTLATFAQKTAVGKESIRISTPFHKFVRVKYTVGGVTPSFDVSLGATLR